MLFKKIYMLFFVFSLTFSISSCMNVDLTSNLSKLKEELVLLKTKLYTLNQKLADLKIKLKEEQDPVFKQLMQAIQDANVDEINSLLVPLPAEQIYVLFKSKNEEMMSPIIKALYLDTVTYGMFGMLAIAMGYDISKAVKAKNVFNALVQQIKDKKLTQEQIWDILKQTDQLGNTALHLSVWLGRNEYMQAIFEQIMNLLGDKIGDFLKIRTTVNMHTPIHLAVVATVFAPEGALEIRTKIFEQLLSSLSIENAAEILTLGDIEGNIPLHQIAFCQINGGLYSGWRRLIEFMHDNIGFGLPGWKLFPDFPENDTRFFSVTKSFFSKINELENAEAVKYAIFMAKDESGLIPICHAISTSLYFGQYYDRLEEMLKEIKKLPAEKASEILNSKFEINSVQYGLKDWGAKNLTEKYLPVDETHEQAVKCILDKYI